MIDKAGERRSAWAFLMAADRAAWEWVRTKPDGTLERSKRSFSSIAECARDASGGGYGEWKMSERRHVTPGRDVLDIQPVATNGAMASHGKPPRPAADKQSNSVSAKPGSEKHPANDM
jgi:hypothetical protein